MNNILLDRTLHFIEKNSKLSDNDLIKIRYGLEGIYLTITKIIIILLIGIVFGYLDTVIITLIFFNFLRFFGFGLHAKKSWQCLISSVLLFNILPLLLLNISVNNYLVIIIGAFSTISFILFAPSDTEKRPLTNKKKRIVRKVMCVLVGLLYLLIILLLKIFIVPILCSLIIESIMINPLSYKIMGLQYNYYKKC